MATGSVLVLTTQQQSGLAVVRSLGQRGLSVVAGGPSHPTLGMLSRFSDGQYVHPDPRTDREAFLDHLLSYLRDEDHDFVFGPTDWMTYLLSKHGDEIERTGTQVAVEDWDTFREVFDKARLFERLADTDVPCPETHAPSSLDEVEAVASEISYPAVVKPRSKTCWSDQGQCQTVLVEDQNYADTPTELIDTYRTVLEETPDGDEWAPLVQEYVPGQTTTTVVLADDGTVRAHFQERRLRTVPPSGGSSALLSVVDDPEMLRYAERVIETFDWTGPAQVEFMERPDGEYVLIEVNGRYWGSLPFAINCGVDFPWLHYRQLRGETVRHDGNYRTDVIQRRSAQDIKWFRQQLAAGNLRAASQFLVDFPRVDHTFVSLSDPLPTAWALSQMPAEALSAIRKLSQP
ncbi:ATP-grasp domain-containing protein [Halorientalis brevis]|uniref:ATP-grasp domain-containing protein n=1 Tax=Halorientalis brevis TaxID=1126241 RepID=A0ABD6CAD5_9EURY|nr:ATP-grasp domain-containing protein [Halorientalis brevis]